MKKGALQAELTRRRARLQAKLQAQRAAAQRRLDEGPAGRARRERRKTWAGRTVVALAFLVLLLARCQECAPKAAVVVVLDGGVSCPTGPLLKPKPVVVRRPEVPPLKVSKQRRPEWDVAPGGPPPWLDGFRLQVAARGPRLAACFDGVERPGALRWSVAMEPVGGAVSEHAFERLAPGPELSATQQACVQGVLSKPGYKLGTAPGAPSTPTRVSMVIEF